MELVHDWGAYQRVLGTARRGSRLYTSNLYAGPEEIKRWCARGDLRALVADKAALLLRADRSFHHVYHLAEDRSALASALAALPKGTYTTDLIGQGEALDSVCSTYADAGFKPHAFLRRMIRTKAHQGASEAEGVIAATSDDAPEVSAFLDRLLDPYTEQVPDVEALQREAQAGRLLLVRHGKTIGGMLMYDLRGRTAHLRFWHVDDKARGQGIGKRLMTSFLSRCAQAQRLVLWVIGDNERSIAIYCHYGFAPDGLLDRIMILGKEPHH